MIIEMIVNTLVASFCAVFVTTFLIFITIGQACRHWGFTIEELYQHYQRDKKLWLSTIGIVLAFLFWIFYIWKPIYILA